MCSLQWDRTYPRVVDRAAWEAYMRDQVLVERYLLAVSAAVGMPIEQFQNIIPQLLQLNDVRRAVMFIQEYFRTPEIPSFNPRDF